VSSAAVDQYLAQFEGLGLITAQALRSVLLELIPPGLEGISYGMPVVKLDGMAIAGYAIAKHHVGYYPHSSLVLEKLPELEGKYKMTKGALQIPHGEVLDRDLVAKLVKLRIELLGLS
jgi:uncharacterized protein YdhG (YjbR/CyaY superfamily)